MQLVTINHPDQIVEGDVIVAKYSDKAYTALVNNIVRVDDDEDQSWLFNCEPVTEVLTENGKQTLKHHDKLSMMYTEDSQQPDAVYAVR